MERIASQLLHLLTEEYLLSGELLALIGQEKQQLINGEDAALDHCISAKHRLLDKLQSVTAQRLRLIEDAGYLQSHTLPGQWAASLADFPALAAQHNLLLALVQKLHEENESLGFMLNRKANFITRLLDNLHQGYSNNSTYQKNGARYAASGSRKLVTV